MTPAAALALLFFAPLAFVYGRHVAHGLHRAAAATGRTPLRLSRGRIVRALGLVLALAIAIAGRETLAAGLPPTLQRNGGVLLVLWALDKIGGLGLILFFLSVPYVMGSALGIAAAATGRLLPPAETAAEDEVDETAAGPSEAPAGIDKTT
ncbi:MULTISPECIES: hypothetical protein [unclassified Aureimonas]|uniref:hypothetical protein n=1 Tax=unclassified Aureimonas TaxID=2615206 RepID=UPI0006F4F4F4|nr:MULTISPECIES: hypothetical protein [unclassified Aureimonas]KQT52554.1 hypothetical protein ASG62_15225 [Aureimonas sp. Leaf427]KQT77545.1 hypothetical protein ASG54_11185 [Aureimonas sp. Leaf460]